MTDASATAVPGYSLWQLLYPLMNRVRPCLRYWRTPWTFRSNLWAWTLAS